MDIDIASDYLEIAFKIQQFFDRNMDLSDRFMHLDPCPFARVYLLTSLIRERSGTIIVVTKVIVRVIVTG